MSSEPGGSGLRLPDLALSLERSAFFHLEAHRADGAGDDGGRREAAEIEVAVAGDLPFNHGLVGLEISLDRGVLPDGQAALRNNVPGNGSIENEIGGTVQISFNLDIAG